MKICRENLNLLATCQNISHCRERPNCFYFKALIVYGRRKVLENIEIRISYRVHFSKVQPFNRLDCYKKCCGGGEVIGHRI